MSTLASWEGVDVTISEITEALDRLRIEDAGVATRTSVATLIITAHSLQETDRALQIIEHMGKRNPARSLVLLVEPKDESDKTRLDALVRLHGSSSNGHPLWSDTVILTVSGPATNHLDSIAEPLALPDVPTVVWFLATAPGPDDTLIGMADVIIVDTKELGAVFALAAVADVSSRRPVVDLSWVRLHPWRSLLADLFESDDTRPFLHGITKVEVTGKSAPRLLLSGWLSSRLGLDPSVISGVDDQHVRIVIESEYEGRTGRFLVERPDDARYVRAFVELQGGTCREEILSLPDESLPWSLAEALTHLEANSVYNEAILAALNFD